MIIMMIITMIITMIIMMIIIMIIMKIIMMIHLVFKYSSHQTAHTSSTLGDKQIYWWYMIYWFVCEIDKMANQCEQPRKQGTNSGLTLANAHLHHMLHIVMLFINRLPSTSLSLSPSSPYFPPHYSPLWKTFIVVRENLSAHQQPSMKSSIAHHSYHQPSLKSYFQFIFTRVTRNMGSLSEKHSASIDSGTRSWFVPTKYFFLYTVLLFCRPLAPPKGLFWGPKT